MMVILTATKTNILHFLRSITHLKKDENQCRHHGKSPQNNCSFND